MSFDPRDYDGVTRESERAERDEARELQAQESDEQAAREMAFHETPFCEEECFETCIHTLACQLINEPVMGALKTWRRAQAIAIRESEAA
jgi:hypothetical protein